MRIKSILDVPTAVLHLVVPRARAAGDDYRPIRPNPGFSRERLDFGTLTGVTARNGVVILHVDRFNFYPDGEIIPAPVAVSDFVLDPKASIQAEKSLRTDREAKAGRQALTRSQFVRNAARLRSEHRGALVWLRHGGAGGHVTALAEQHVPRRG